MIRSGMVSSRFNLIAMGKLMVLLLVLVGLTGCSRSLRGQAVKVAANGKTTAEQMGSYYDLLAKDTVDVWELTAFKRGYLGLPQTDETKRIQKAYQERYLALLARKRLAGTVATTYDQFSRLSSYDSSSDVMASLAKLSESAKGLTGRPLIPPDSSSTPVSATNAIGALVSELQTVAENRAILRDNKRLVALLDKVKTVFDSELPVCQSIADDKKRVYTDVAQSLVKGGVVDSTALVERVLATYELKWPAPTKPFDPNNPAQRPLVEAIVSMIEARAHPVAEASKDAGTQLSESLEKLLAAHRALVAGKPLSLQELVKQNALVQDLLEALLPRVDTKKLLGAGGQ